MALYNDKNLIKYEDTIQLHFDKTGKTAWLTLTNCGFVFGKGNEDASKVFTVTVGVPATQGGELPLTPEDRDYLKKQGFENGQFKPCAETISIGSMLDAIDVIKFQILILKISGLKKNPKVFRRDLLIRNIAFALEKMSNATFAMLCKEDDPEFLKNTRDWLERNWFARAPDRPGAPEIREAIRDYSPGTVGFTAYFPNAGLVAQEERTLKKGDKGKTVNNDTRAIDPIPSGMTHAVGAQVKDDFAKGQWEFQWIVDQLDIDITNQYRKEFGTEIPNEGARRLHARIQRISCFGFRGDDRNPQELKKASGFLPGVTRRDAKYMENYKRRADDIDVTLPYLPTKANSPFNKALYEKLKHGSVLTSKDISPELKKYLDQMKNWSVMHLGQYTFSQEFKGYISATKSTAIAKHFSNLWSDEVDLTTYCYAVRCRGGFHLQSTVADPDIVGSDAAKAFLKELHQFNSFAEQEVAVAGAIWWEHVVGMRTIRCNKDGQFFFGPVFLRADLMWEDNAAFSALFELLSGKSQGEAAGVIEKSYEASPFECLDENLTTKGANAISLALTAQSPLARLNPSTLIFSQQAVDSKSAPQILTLTNLGGQALVVQPFQISGANSQDFVVSAHGEGMRRTYSVTFEPKGPFKPKTKRVGESNKKYEVDERTATLNFTHNLAGSPHQVSLKGSAAAAARPWRLSSAEIKFDKQALFTHSAPKIFTLSIDSPKEIPITVSKASNLSSDFSIGGDYENGELHHTYSLRVIFTPQKIGESRFTFMITYEGNKDPILVEVSGTGKAQRIDYSLSPKSLDFGKQAVDSVSAQSGTLTNTGNVPFNFDRVEVTGKDAAAFTWESDAEATVEPDQKSSILVKFCPANGPRNYEAALQIASDDPILRITIPLKGKAF